MDGAGRVLLRDSRREDRSSPLVANLLKGIVDDYVSMTGQLPDVRVPPPGAAQSDQDFADVVEKYHYGVWWASQMVLQLKAMAWWNSVMSACAAVVWPNFVRKHAEIRFVGPDKVYGVPDLVDPFAYSSVIISEPFSARSISDRFPEKVVRDAINAAEDRGMGWPQRGRTEVVRWFDKKEVVTVVGREVQSIRD